MLISSSVNGRISNCIGTRQEARCDKGICLLHTNMSVQLVVTVDVCHGSKCLGFEIVEENWQFQQYE